MKDPAGESRDSGGQGPARQANGASAGASGEAGGKAGGKAAISGQETPEPAGTTDTPSAPDQRLTGPPSASLDRPATPAGGSSAATSAAPGPSTPPVQAGGPSPSSERPSPATPEASKAEGTGGSGPSPAGAGAGQSGARPKASPAGGAASPAGTPSPATRASTAAAGPRAASEPRGGGATAPSRAGSGPSGGTRPAPPPPSGGGSGGWIGGLIGGVIGGAAAWVLLTYFIAPGADPELQALNARVDQLGEAVTGFESETAQMIDLAARVDSLEAGADAGLMERVQALEERSGAFEQQAATSQDLLARLESLESGGGGVEAEGLIERLEALEGSLAGGGDGGSAALTDLSTRLDAVEEKANAAAQAPALVEQLQERLAQIESQIGPGAIAGVGDAPAGQGQIAQLNQRVTEAEEVAARAGQVADDLTILDTRLSELAGRVDEVGAAVPELGSQLATTIDDLAEQTEDNSERIQALASNVEGIGQQVQAVQQRVESVAGEMQQVSGRLDNASDMRDRAVGLALVTGELGAAIDQAEPFEEPLQRLKALGGEDASIGDAAARLQPLAESGVPSLTTLRREFDQVADEIVHAARAPEDEGVLGQAANNLMRMVSVRPVGGETEGDDPAARVARAEAKLGEGDLAGAVSELEPLEGAPADAAAPWLEQARARLDAQQAVGDLNARATGLLTGGP